MNEENNVIGNLSKKLRYSWDIFLKKEKERMTYLYMNTEQIIFRYFGRKGDSVSTAL